MAIVYRHRRLDTNEIFYIGIGTKTKRAFETYNRNNFWKKIVNKTAYEVEIIAKDLSWEDACELEIFLIKLYGRKNLNKGSLVNLTDGGEGSVGIIQSEETKLKKSISLKGKNLGKKHTEETKEKLRLKNLGRKHTQETKEKIGKWDVNRVSGMKGKTQSNETKLKRLKSGAGNKKIVLDLETGIFYETIKEAAFVYDYHRITLSKKIKNNEIKNLKII